MGRIDSIQSKGLQAAQQRLLLLRGQFEASRVGAGRQRPPLSEASCQDVQPITTETAPTSSRGQAVSQLPPHLGWESTPFSLTVRKTTVASAAYCTDALVQATASTSLDETAVSPPHPIPKTVKVYPDIAIGLLRQEQVAAGRLWLLLQAADVQGGGWLAEKEARRLFTDKRASLRFCGVRQLRNLLGRGDGLFWTRGNGRIWLRSATKVAFALDISRLQMRPVAVPVSILRQKIGTVRAHLYATFHSGRSKINRANNPIARTTVARITHVQPRTQRRYERKAKVKQQRQFAIGGQATVENMQSRGWKQGRATFQLKDFKGKQGQAGRSYVAWQLPNSYVGPHAQLPKGRQKRINRALTDLFMQGMTGNGQRSRRLEQHFFGNGRLASKACLRNPEEDHYWRGQGNGRYQLWQVIEGQGRFLATEDTEGKEVFSLSSSAISAFSAVKKDATK